MKTLYVLGLIVLTAVGCAKKNPIEGRAPAVPDQAPLQGPQKFPTCTAEVEAPASLAVVEGHSGSHEISVRGIDANVTDQLTVKGANQNVKIQKASDGKYVITYTAPRGTIENGKDHFKTTIELHPKSEYNLGKNCGKTMDLYAMKTAEIPSVKSVSNLPKSFDLTSDAITVATVQVIAKDLNSSGKLHLDVTYDPSTSSKENVVYALQQAIEVSQAVKVAANTYNFTLAIDPFVVRTIIERKKVDTSVADIEMMLQLRAYNEEAQTVSPPLNVGTKFKRPVIKPEVKAPETKKANKTEPKKEEGAKS